MKFSNFFQKLYTCTEVNEAACEWFLVEVNLFDTHRRHHWLIYNIGD